MPSRPAWGAWIEMAPKLEIVRHSVRRAPHGARGLKCHSGRPVEAVKARRAPHGARGLKYSWSAISHRAARRAPHGARGLKYINSFNVTGKYNGRAPHGARGLKYGLCQPLAVLRGSRPAWGAWIEMLSRICPSPAAESRPAWGAWIEMIKNEAEFRKQMVAPRMGRVD